MNRPITTVLMESVIIGLMNLVIINLLIRFAKNIPHKTQYILAGALIHLIFEYSGGNKWWCTQTYKL